MQIRTETKVGAFVIVALTIFAYIAVYLGVFNLHLHSYEPYHVLFQDVSGLAPQADVKIAGVRVGWVDQIQLNSTNNQAEVRLMVDHRYQVYANGVAEIHQEGLLGSKYVDLAPGSASSGRLTAGAYLSLKGQSPPNIEDLMQRFGKIAENIEEVSAALKVVLGPEQQNKIQSIVNSVADFSTHLSPNVEKISAQVSQAVDTVNSIVQKVDTGEGVFGRLVNDGQLYDDIKRVSCSFREASDAYERMGLVVDSHVEAMSRASKSYDHKNSKGYFGVRLHTNDEWFYLFQMVGDEAGGVVSRNGTFNSYYNSYGQRLTDAELADLGGAYIAYPALNKEIKYMRNTVRYSYQVGRIFGSRVALRFGAFEDFFGCAADCSLFDNEYFRWITSIELWDFRGQNHIDDRRPHAKWLNRLFLLDNFYFDFGLDDFVSKDNFSPFFGLGLRFGDDDLKVLLARFGMPVAKT